MRKYEMYSGRLDPEMIKRYTKAAKKLDKSRDELIREAMAHYPAVKKLKI